MVGISKEYAMCDYSLHCVASRAAQATETLMVTNFRGTSTRGFASPGDPTVAVCLRPGTEIAFEQEACREGLFFRKKIGARVARFRQVELNNPTVHHDALEFPDGTIVKVNDLLVGQRARIVQLPAEPKIEAAAPKQEPVHDTPDLVIG
jgi:hypothetical protein